MMALGLLWAIFAPLSLIALIVGLGALFRLLGRNRVNFVAALGVAAAIVLVPVSVVWRVDRQAFAELCRVEGAPVIRETAKADGFLLVSGTSNSFGMRYLQSEGFDWMEADDIYRRGEWVRYVKDGAGQIATVKIAAPTALYEVRETFEKPTGASGLSRTNVIERATGRELARGASLTFDGGRLKWVLGAWGVASCPEARTDPDAFNAWYHLARNTLR
jgi:hypothetical protein